MRANTKKRKKATVMLKATQEQEWWADQVVQVMLHGKRALDAAMLDVGRLVAETLMYMEREERSGPDYHPTSSGLMKWASQRGSIYVGDQKLCVEHPRLRGDVKKLVETCISDSWSCFQIYAPELTRPSGISVSRWIASMAATTVSMDA